MKAKSGKHSPAFVNAILTSATVRGFEFSKVENLRFLRKRRACWAEQPALVVEKGGRRRAAKTWVICVEGAVKSDLVGMLLLERLKEIVSDQD